MYRTAPAPRADLHLARRSFSVPRQNAQRCLGLACLVICFAARASTFIVPERSFQVSNSPKHSVAFSPDGAWVLTGSSDRTAKLWNTQTGVEIRTFTGHQYIVHSAVFSPDGAYVLTGSGDWTAKLWNTQTGAEMWTFAGHASEVNAVDFSPDGVYVLTGSEDWTAKLLNSQTGEEIRTFSGHASGVRSVAFSPDGAYVLTSSGDWTARLWDTHTGTEIRTFFPSEGLAAFSPNGKRVLIGHTLWDVDTGEEIQTFASSEGPVAFSPNGTLALIGHTLWNVDTGEEIRRFADVVYGSDISASAFSPDGAQVVLCVQGYAQIHEASTGRVLATCAEGPALSSIAHTAFSPDGSRLATSSTRGGVYLWDVLTRTETKLLPEPQDDHAGKQVTLAFTPDSSELLTLETFWDGFATPTFWNARTGQQVRQLNEIRFSIPADGSLRPLVRFAPGGAQFITTSINSPTASGYGDFTYTAHFWDTATGHELFQVALPTNWSPVDISADLTRTLLINRSRNLQVLIELPTGVVLRGFAIQSTPASWVDLHGRISYDSSRILLSSDMGAQLFDALSGEWLQTFPGLAVAISADLSQVVTSWSSEIYFSNHQFLRWKTATGTLENILSIPFQPWDFVYKDTHLSQDATELSVVSVGPPSFLHSWTLPALGEVEGEGEGEGEEPPLLLNDSQVAGFLIAAFDRADLDGNGRLNFSEARDYLAARGIDLRRAQFDRIDADHDEALSTAELVNANAPAPGPSGCQCTQTNPAFSCRRFLGEIMVFLAGAAALQAFGHLRVPPA